MPPILRDIATIAGLITPPVLMALLWWLQKYFARKEDFDQHRASCRVEMVQMETGLTSRADKLTAMSSDMKGLGERVDRYEKLTLGSQDHIARMSGEINSLHNETRILDEFGGKVVQEMKRELTDINRKLDRLLIQKGDRP